MCTLWLVAALVDERALNSSPGLRHASTTAAPDRHHNAPMRSAFVRESGAGA